MAKTTRGKTSTKKAVVKKAAPKKEAPSKEEIKQEAAPAKPNGELAMRVKLLTSRIDALQDSPSGIYEGDQLLLDDIQAQAHALQDMVQA